MTTLKDLLDSKNCLKIICGAGNEDLAAIENIVSVYYAAGCRFFDLCMSQEALDIAKQAAPDAFFCISYGTKEDPHSKKASIDSEKCIRCGKCREICPQKAVRESLKIDKTKCIGCGRCYKNCHKNAIEMKNEVKNLEEILPCLKNYDCIELHCSDLDDIEVEKKWEFIFSHFDGFLSICMDRSKLSNEQYISRIKRLIAKRAPYTTIIQADGAPMSGGCDDYKTTLQAVAMAEIIQNANLAVYILISGGTNSKSAELAKMCGVDINGVAIGSYARKIIKGLSFNEAVIEAKKLINN